MAIKALVFDMDGLVFDTERVVQRTWARAGAELGYPGMENVIYHTLGLNRKRRTEFFGNIWERIFRMRNLAGVQESIFMKLPKKKGLP